MPIIEPAPDSTDAAPAVVIRVKAVPGAKRDEIVGPLDERLKVRVSQPPEGGRANAAVLALITRALGLRPADAEIIAGHASPSKTIRARGITPGQAAAALGL